MKKGTVIISIEELFGLKDKIDKSDNLCGDLHNQVMEGIRKVNKLSAEKDALEQKLENHEDKIELNILREENRLLSKYIDELRQEIDRLRNSNTLLEAQNQKMTAESENKSAYIGRLEREAIEMKQEQWHNQVHCTNVTPGKQLYDKMDIMILPQHFLNHMNRKEFTVKNFTEFLEGFLK